MRILIRDLFDPGSRMEKFRPGIRNIGGERQAAAAHGLAVQYARTDTRKYSFSVRVVDPWNRLPDPVKTAPTKEAFKGVELKHNKLHKADNRSRGL